MKPANPWTPFPGSRAGVRIFWAILSSVLFLTSFTSALAGTPTDGNLEKGESELVCLDPPNVEGTFDLVNKTGGQINDIQIDSWYREKDKEVIEVKIEYDKNNDGTKDDITKTNGVNEVDKDKKGKQTTGGNLPDGDGTAAGWQRGAGGDNHSGIVEVDFTDPVPNDGAFRIKVKIESGGSNKKRCIALRGTLNNLLVANTQINGGREDALVANLANQPVSSMTLAEVTSGALHSGTVILDPLTAGFTFTGSPVATVTAGNVGIGSASVVSGSIQIPITSTSTSPSQIEINNVTVTTTALFPAETDTPALAQVRSPSTGGADIDYFPIATTQGAASTPALSTFAWLLCVLAIAAGGLTVAALRRRRLVS